MQNERLHRLVRIAVLATMAFFMTMAQVYVPPFAEFLRYDPGDVPAIIATYTMGPLAGLTVQVIKALLFLVSGKSSAGLIGVVANFLAGAVLVLVAGALHRVMERAGLRAWSWGLVSAAAGTLLMAAIMIPINALVVYPGYGMSGEAAWQGAIYLSTPFNLFKAFTSSLVSLAFYRRLTPILVGNPAGRAA